jgi:cell fate regulator YaaT (PSP1 superfamily)
VIVDADRGEDLGHVHAVGEEAEQRSAKVPHGLLGAAPARVARRIATEEDVSRHAEVRASDDDARRRAMERVKANALVMKMTDAEWQWDRKKLTFYFTAEKRVDFRTLVRELASMFRTRIELKQIGVRDEAKRLDGIGRCGRQYCSASWLPELRPVNLGVAKDQRLSLNPSQISGACGRLMCCLRYEHEFYVMSRRKYPKEGKTVRTSKGEEKVIANDIFRERVTLRGMDGETRLIPLVELRAEMTTAEDPLASALSAAALEQPPAFAPDDMRDSEDADADGILSEDRPVMPTRRDARQRPRREPRPAPSRPPEAPTATAETSVDASAGTSDATPPAEGERRVQRRRGRRGGRRNRPGGNNDGNTNGGGPPAEQN